jgi:solute carrier family 25 phosphate transporter 23/24/25/41
VTNTNINLCFQGIIPYVGIKMASFDIIKTYIHFDRSHPNFTMLNLGVGGMAGFLSIIVTYPTDLLRRRMQVRGQGGYENYTSMYDCCTKIVK